jgi:cupin 2 domain protein
MANILRNIPIAEVLSLSDTVTYAEGQVVSKTLVQNEGVGITLFAFAKGEGISTHESKGDALVVVLDGKGRLTIDGKDYELAKGDSIVMPANHPHAVYGIEAFKMLLVVTFPER